MDFILDTACFLHVGFALKVQHSLLCHEGWPQTTLSSC